MENHLTTKELSKRWNITVNGLANWRDRGVGPRYIKFKGAVRYRLSDILDYEKKRLITPEKA